MSTTLLECIALGFIYFYPFKNISNPLCCQWTSTTRLVQFEASVHVLQARVARASNRGHEHIDVIINNTGLQFFKSCLLRK